MTIHKICPCNSCGKTNMCVSHDTFCFYCNRCLPYFNRQKFYDTPEIIEPVVQQENVTPVTTGKTIGRKPKS